MLSDKLPGDHSGACEGGLDLFLEVSSLLLALLLDLVDEVEHCVLSHHLETHVNVQQHSMLFLDESGIEAWPHFDLVGVQCVSGGLVE